MARSKEQRPVGIGPGTADGAAPVGPTGVGSDELYGADGLGDMPGTLGLGGAAGQIVLAHAGGTAGKRVASRTAKLKMQVSIIEHPKQSVLTDKSRESIRSAVESEFKRIRSQLKRSKAEFKVSWTQPKKLSPSVAVPKILQVYVIENSAQSIQQAHTILKTALPGVSVKAQEIANHIASEGGFNYRRSVDSVSVSFVSVSRLEQYKKAGVAGIDKMFANIVLHELGHGMGADHPDQGLMTARQVYDSRGGRLFKYSQDSTKKIDKFLSGL